MQLQQKKFALKNSNIKKSSPMVMGSRQAEHNKTQDGNTLDKIIKTMYDLKAVIGCFRNAMDTR